MFYQDSNDYMRDSCFWGNGMNNNNMMYGNMQNPYTQNNYQIPMGMQQGGMNSLENMYPQIYKIISPVVNRVISNSNYQFMTEDILNNMTDTVYNIVEGDVSSLISSQNQSVQGDDTVTVNSTTNPTAMSNNRNQNSNSNSSSANDRRGNNGVDNKTNNNRLLRDLIKIILIKELLSRRNNNNNYNNSNFLQNQGMQMNGYNPMPYGMF